MKVQVSGKMMELEDGITVEQLMEQQKVESPQYVTVVINKEFLPFERYSSVTLKEGDTVEFLYFMGGGAYGTEQWTA